MWITLPPVTGRAPHSVLIPASFGKTLDDFETVGEFLAALRVHHEKSHAQSQ